MTAKWFTQSEDNGKPMESMSSATDPSFKKPKLFSTGTSTSRLSATFAESRPWNFMTSAHSDRSSTSSRKRLSLFGARSSTASSADIFSSDYSPPRDSSLTQASRPDFPTRPESIINSSRPESRFSNDSKVTESGPGDSWRSSIFSRKRSTRLIKGPDNKDEPFLRWLRGDSRSSSWKHSCDFDREQISDEAFYHTLKKRDISAPFNFQHVTHTQQNQLPVMDSVTDSELQSEFWAAAAYQSPKGKLRGIKADNIDSNYRSRPFDRPDTSSSMRSGSLSLKTGSGPLTANVSSTSVHEFDRNSQETGSDAESPSDETARSLSLGSRTGSLSRLNLPSRERLLALSAEQREPPTMIHPALRGQNITQSESRSSSQGQVFELPATSLESVPEEMEGYGPSPARGHRARAMLDLSPLGSPSMSPRSSPSLATTARHKNGLVFTPFPMGNAFAQAYGGSGAEVSRTSCESRLSFGADGNLPSLTSGESWENDIDFCYLVEAESSCDFDWDSIKSSRKGSEASTRRDSSASAPAHRGSYGDASRRTSMKSQPDDGLFADFDGCSNLVNEPVRHDSPQLSSTSRLDLSPILESPAQVSTKTTGSELVGPMKSQHTRSTSLDERIKENSPLNKSARWSIASPSCLPEDAKTRGISFTHSTMPRSGRKSVPVSFPAPSLPPPQSALPPLPTQQSARPISPPLSPTTTSPHIFPTMRRPSSSQDRALLQAAGRCVRNGRASSRPTTPSRLSHVQHTTRASAMSTEPPSTATKMGMVEYKLGVLATPPNSPPQQHQGFQQYPAWI